MNPIKYASRTYQTILNDINNVDALADKPDFFKKMVAGVGDVCSMINNAEANNHYLGTAFTRDAVKEECRLIGYEMPEQTTSIGTMLFYFPYTVSFPLTVSAENLAATTRGTMAISAKRFESRTQMIFPLVTEVVNLTANPIANNAALVARDFLTGEKVRVISSGSLPTGLSNSRDYYIIRVDATHVQFALTVSDAFSGIPVAISDGSGNMTITLFSGRVTAYQQEAKTNIKIGTSDGITPWQTFDLPDFNVLSDTVVITVNGAQWSVVDTLALSKGYEANYQLLYKTDGTCYIRFGNGTNGAIPGNFDILATYAKGGGSDSVISALNTISVYAGSDANITGCTNATAFTGGSDPQSIETAKNTAPGTLKNRDRFVTVDDGESIALRYGGISIARVIPNAYGVLSAKVVCIAIGGGNPNTTTKTGLQTYLIERTIFGGMDIRVQDAIITPYNVVSAAKILPGYTFTGVLPFFRLAWKLALSETGQEIVDIYKSSGIAAAVTRINTLFSESFTSDYYTKIQNQLDALYKFGAADFGFTLRADDITAFVRAYVDGVDYFTYSSPTFPIACAADQITTYGTLTLTEIA
jgi:hypothetical protein